MGQINGKLQIILDNFGAKTPEGTGGATETALINALQSSPPLLDAMNLNAKTGALTNISYQSTGTGAFYDNKGGIVVTQDYLGKIGSNPLEEIGLLGHEDFHVTNADTLAIENAVYIGMANTLYRLATNSGGLIPPPDLTNLAALYRTANLKNEAQADITGWNAEVAAANSGGGPIDIQTLRDLKATTIGQRLFGGDGDGSLPGGLTLGSTGSITFTNAGLQNYAQTFAERLTSGTGNTIQGVVTPFNYGELYDAGFLNGVFNRDYAAILANSGGANSLTVRLDFSQLGLPPTAAGFAGEMTDINNLFAGGFNCGLVQRCNLLNIATGDAASVAIGLSGTTAVRGSATLTGPSVPADAGLKAVTSVNYTGAVGQYAPGIMGPSMLALPSDATITENADGTFDISGPNVVTATIGGNAVTIITPTVPDSNGATPPPFAVIQSTDASASSSNVLAYPQGPVARTAGRSYRRRVGSLGISHDRGRRSHGPWCTLMGIYQAGERWRQ